MSNAISGVGQFFGLSQPKTQSYQGPTSWRTPYSSMENGTLSMDPSIRSLQETGLGRSNELYGNLGGSLGAYNKNSAQLREMLMGNKNAYLEARLNPIRQQFATRQGEVSQNIGLRGMGGSSFGEQALTNVSTDFARQESDARAMAERESMADLQGLNKDDINAAFQTAELQSKINGDNFQVAQQRLQQELTSLGLSSQQIGQFMNAWQADQQNRMAGYNAQTSRLGTMYGKGGVFGQGGMTETFGGKIAGVLGGGTPT